MTPRNAPRTTPPDDSPEFFEGTLADGLDDKEEGDSLSSDAATTRDVGSLIPFAYRGHRG